ncbi:11213_t:CDS:2 [Paraglomus brasilianum]|uniref:11213_t:CDS:1 n=1 Tax=Paraglomus brasilianum TaxID=144538 RepID=A0A9N9B1U3_9GLOM|nr:11213_t:CDS:2 [Paraglomus brasilianum]
MKRMLLKRELVSMGEVIGEGAMGEVYSGTYQNVKVAIKKSKHTADFGLVLKELTAHCQLDHQYVLKFIGVIKTAPSYSLVLEYAEQGDLKSYLKTHTVPLSVKSKICHDIALGLTYCHEQNIVHFDLKTENILLTDNLTPKISDFGVSSSKMELGLRGNKAGGTIAWVAPERVVKNETMRNLFKEFPKLSDIYSFGLIMWSVALNGKCPYANETAEAIRKEKSRKDHASRLLEQLPREIHTTYKEQIENLLEYEPRDRGNLWITRLGLEELGSGRSTLVNLQASEKNSTTKVTSNDIEVKRSVLAENKSKASPEKSIVQSTNTTAPEEWSSDKLITLVEGNYINGFIKSKAAINVCLKKYEVNPGDIFAEFQYLARKSSRHKFIVGWFHEIGLGTERDNTKAFECYKEAAEKGNTHAAYKLGLCYYNDGNWDAARGWLSKASSAGHLKAKEKIHDYFKLLPTSVIVG